MNEKSVKFAKMHGLGNDFIIIPLNQMQNFDLSPGKVKRLCHRRMGIGADGILVLKSRSSSEIEDNTGFDLTIFNSDGSRASMCGNGVRCAAHYLKKQGMIEEKVNLHTDAGRVVPEIINIEQENKAIIRANIGCPVFFPDLIPVKEKFLEVVSENPGGKEKCRESPPEIKFYHIPNLNKNIRACIVSMGNPHAVLFTSKSLNNIPLKSWGSYIENHKAFPKKTNVEFARIEDRKNIKLKVWERGAGLTLACGTGAAAAAAAAIKKGYTEEFVNVHLPGGKLAVDWNSESIYIEGPSRLVFTGKINTIPRVSISE